jgi:hypothetical protein
VKKVLMGLFLVVGTAFGASKDCAMRPAGDVKRVTCVRELRAIEAQLAQINPGDLDSAHLALGAVAGALAGFVLGLPGGAPGAMVSAMVTALSACARVMAIQSGPLPAAQRSLSGAVTLAVAKTLLINTVGILIAVIGGGHLLINCALSGASEGSLLGVLDGVIWILVAQGALVLISLALDWYAVSNTLSERKELAKRRQELELARGQLQDQLDALQAPAYSLDEAAA